MKHKQFIFAKTTALFVAERRGDSFRLQPSTDTGQVIFVDEGHPVRLQQAAEVDRDDGGKAAGASDPLHRAHAASRSRRGAA